MYLIYRWDANRYPSGPRNNSNEGVLHTSQSSKTGSSLLNAV